MSMLITFLAIAMNDCKYDTSVFLKKMKYRLTCWMRFSAMNKTVKINIYIWGGCQIFPWKLEAKESFLIIILAFSGKKEVSFIVKIGHWKLNTMMEPQQAQMQKGEHDSVSAWWLWWSIWAKFSFPLFNILQSSVSLQGSSESMRM